MKDLSYTYIGTSPLSPTIDSGTLVFDGTSDWLSASFAGSYTIDLQCVDGVVTPRIMLSSVSQCTFDVPSTAQCNSLFLGYDVPNPSAAYTAGFRVLQITDPGPYTVCSEPCSCVNCPACGGVIIIPGGTVTDKNGTHAVTGNFTGTIPLTGLPAWFGTGGLDDGCHVGTGDFEYNIRYVCNSDGTIYVTVNAPGAATCQEGGVPPITCGYIALIGPYEESSTITCGDGTLSFFADFSSSFGISSCSNDIEPIVDVVTFSLPLASLNTMCQSFILSGCNGMTPAGLFAGLTVRVYDHEGGVLLWSGVTNSGGGIPTVYFTQTDDNTYWITCDSPDPRLQSFANTMTLTCASETSINFSTTDGYVCVSGCAIPLETAADLFATHPVFGSLTMVYNGAGSFGAGWYATTSYSYVGCSCCPSKIVTITSYLNRSLQYSDHWIST